MAITNSYLDDPTRKRYYGTSTERAAMSTGAVAIGSRFYESNTNLEYVWDGSGWVAWLLHTVA